MKSKSISPSAIPSIFECKIIHNIELSPHIFRIRLESKDIPSHASPGHFINIKITDQPEPFWRRPFSIHQINTVHGWFDVLYRLVGKGTSILSQKKAGDNLNFVGPLGRAFQVSDSQIEKAYVVGGGLGIAPLLFLCVRLINQGITPSLFYGVKSDKEFCCLQDFVTLNINMFLATEDGSTGHRGFITDVVEAQLNSQTKNELPALFACGPNPMLYKISRIAHEKSLRCQVSLETLMGCGIGACLGCGVKTNDNQLKYLYVCKDGPVFNAHEIDLSE